MENRNNYNPPPYLRKRNETIISLYYGTHGKDPLPPKRIAMLLSVSVYIVYRAISSMRNIPAKEHKEMQNNAKEIKS